MYIDMSVYLCICLYIFITQIILLYVSRRSTNRPIYLFIHICLYTYPSIYRSIKLSKYWPSDEPIYLYSYVCIDLSYINRTIYLSTDRSAYLSVDLSLSLSFSISMFVDVPSYLSIYLYVYINVSFY